jgi:hypothetical protein
MLQPRGPEICETNQLFHEGLYLAIIEMNISRVSAARIAMRAY